MTTPIPLPTPDPMPLPGPVWLMMTLLLVTFLLHLLAMNLTVGGTAIAIVCSLRRKKDAFAGQLFDAAIRVLPVSLAFTVTLGVAALLFVQVLYGNFLYTSSILIGVFWIAVIPALIVAYYSLYYSKAHPQQTGSLYLALALMLAIGFIYVNNFTLMLAPDRWLELYRRSTAGMNLNLSDATLLPRYLHFMLSALAIAGLVVFAAGVWNRSTEYGRWLMAQGSHWCVASTVVNYLVGMWFMMALPRSVLMDLFAGSALAASLVGFGMLLPLAAVMHTILAVRTSKSVLHARLAVATTLLTMIVMVALRQVVRAAYLRPYVSIREMRASPQWSVIGLFLLLFVAGLITVYWMLGRTLTSTHTARAASQAAGD